MQGAKELWGNREAALAALEPGGIGGACVLTVGSASPTPAPGWAGRATFLRRSKDQAAPDGGLGARARLGWSVSRLLR